MGIVARLFGKKHAPATIPLGETAYRNLLADCAREMRDKNAQLEALYGTERHDRWDLNQEMGDLVLSAKGTPLLRASVALAGRYSPAQGQWLWGWADNAISAGLAQSSRGVRDYGTMHLLTDLTGQSISASEEKAWQLASLACRILGGSGVYRGDLDGNALFLVITGIDDR